MKSKILILGLALMISATAFVQGQTTEKKPTKEETVAWLVKYLKLYVVNNYRDKVNEVEIEDCILTHYSVSEVVGPFKVTAKTIVSPIVKVERSGLRSGKSFSFYTKSGSQVSIEKKNETVQINKDEAFILGTDDEQLVERVKKAWNHLAELCAEEEAF